MKHSEQNSGTQNKAFSLQFIILLVETLEKYTVCPFFEIIILYQIQGRMRARLADLSFDVFVDVYSGETIFCGFLENWNPGTLP